MAYQVSWLIEKQVILTTVKGEFTLTELANQSAQILEHLAVGRQNDLIHLIIDFRYVSKYPINIAEISRNTSIRNQANMGWLVVVTDNRMIRFVINVVTQLSKTRFRNYDTLKEAVEFLKTQDASLDWSLMTINIDEAS